jgi:uncharacterized membrane protein
MTTAGVLLLLICTWMPQFRNIVLLSGALIPMGLVLIVLSLITTWYEKKADFIEDERTLKIRAHTYMKAFSFSMLVVCVLFILVCLKLLVLDTLSAILIIFLTMALSSSLLFWYYYRQGDINKD